jgi:hypothetical protein
MGRNCTICPHPMVAEVNRRWQGRGRRPAAVLDLNERPADRIADDLLHAHVIARRDGAHDGPGRAQHASETCRKLEDAISQPCTVCLHPKADEINLVLVLAQECGARDALLADAEAFKGRL